MITPIEFSSMSIQGMITRRGMERKHTNQVGDGTNWGREMEMVGVVFRADELRGGSTGSYVAEECCWGWKAFFC